MTERSDETGCQGGRQRLLGELGLDPNGVQQTKTKTALEYFAKIAKQSGS
jgi:hypothetical protein